MRSTVRPRHQKVKRPRVQDSAPSASISSCPGLASGSMTCGLTPQYEGLERLHETYGPKGFSVLGFPCNQFAGQEPGTPEEIEEFCRNEYSVTFPLFEKIDVNGAHRHPLYEQLVGTADGE